MVHSISVTEVLEKVLPWHLGNSVKELLRGTIPLERRQLVTGRGNTHAQDEMSEGGPSEWGKRRRRVCLWEGDREILLNNKAAVISWLSKWCQFVACSSILEITCQSKCENRNSLLLPPAGNACGIQWILLSLLYLTLAAGVRWNSCPSHSWQTLNCSQKILMRLSEVWTEQGRSTSDLLRPLYADNVPESSAAPTLPTNWIASYFKRRCAAPPHLA